jgi:hypothetical protein
MTMETGAGQDKKTIVFITYCWDDGEAHHTKVHAFTNMLRQNSFNADVDRNIAQQRTSIDFSTMMYNTIQGAEKVVVVLSKAYKRKAEQQLGGWG